MIQMLVLEEEVLDFEYSVADKSRYCLTRTSYLIRLQ